MIEHQGNKYLQVDMYDDVNAAPGSELGEYSEKFKLEKNDDGKHVLYIEAGPLAKKYTKEHGRMWDEAIKIIEETAEK